MHALRCTTNVSAGIAFVGAMAAPLLAADCQLHVTTSSAMVSSGQPVLVDVWGQFPSDAFAFAAAEFDLLATWPMWTQASSGVLAGSDVLGATAWQDHLPMTGVIADDANPRRIWSGVFTPDVVGPAAVTITASPSSFTFYPSELTSSSVSCLAGPGSTTLFVDPLPVGVLAHAAPRAGTGMDVQPGHRIVATPNIAHAVLITLLLPAIQNVRETSTRVDWPELPEVFEIVAEIELDGDAGDAYPTEQLTLNYARVETFADGDLIYDVTLSAMLGALEGSFCMDNVTPSGQVCMPGTTGLQIGRVPDSVRHRIVELADGTMQLHIILGTNEPRRVHMPGVFDGVTSEPVVVRAAPDFYLKLEGIPGESKAAMNKLKQIGLAVQNDHDVLTTSPLIMTLEPALLGDVNLDGDVDVDDLLLVLAAWGSNDICPSDVDNSGEVDVADLLIVLGNWG